MFVFPCSYSFSLEGYIPTHRVGLYMPSKMTVALSLDDESSEIWNGLPRGERSQYVRESMKEIDLVRVQEDLIRKLRARLDAAEKKIKDMKLWGLHQ